MTTSVHSVSTACSSGSYVYRMQCLGQDESQDLFWRKVYGYQSNRPRGSLDEGSKSIFSKCDGLPLALSSVAKYLGANADRLERCDCEDMGRDLGTRYLSGDHDVFREMRRSLVQCCHRLPDYDHRACLLYLSVFPRAHHIKNKSLVRRLMAEGLVATAQHGSKCVNMLVDNCIVDAMQFSSDSRDAKRCRVHGIVLEYIIHMSVSKNIVTLIQDEGMQRVDSAVARVRRLSIQPSNQGTCAEIPTGISLSDVRSLTIFNSISNFRSCEMLRLLDLEGCTWVANDSQSLDGIGGLFLLKYLSLRNTGVKRLPTQMEKLQRLETLDIRDTETEVKKLPLEVIMLPKLAYLFGKFELPDVPKVTNTVLDFLTKKSELHTLAGFDVPSRTRGLEQLILQAPKLKKVKVWCNDNSAGVPMSGSPALVLASSSGSGSGSASCPGRQLKRKIYTLHSSKTKEQQTLNQNLTIHRADESGTGNISSILLPKKCLTSLESVSIDSSALCKGFLCSLEGTCKISSIKLRGKLDCLPDSTRLHFLDKINKLQLFSTGLSSEDWSALQMLAGLEYLKLVEDDDRFCNGIFNVKKNGFQSLKRLCIEAPSIPRLQFMEGSMGFLISLHLLCPGSAETELAAETIEGFSHLTRLNEVVLHASASEGAMQAWEEVANRHPKWPSVVKLAAESNKYNAAPTL